MIRYYSLIRFDFRFTKIPEMITKFCYICLIHWQKLHRSFNLAYSYLPFLTQSGQGIFSPSGYVNHSPVRGPHMYTTAGLNSAVKPSSHSGAQNKRNKLSHTMRPFLGFGYCLHLSTDSKDNKSDLVSWQEIL